MPTDTHSTDTKCYYLVGASDVEMQTVPNIFDTVTTGYTD